MRTQVAIIGGGPAGLLLSQILHKNDIDCIVLERRTRKYVLQRIRAGVLEWGSVEVLRAAGIGERMDAEGHLHDGTDIVWAGSRRCQINTLKHTGKPLMAYGQTAITEDLYAARDAMGGTIVDEAEEVAIHNIAGDAPYLTYSKNGEQQRVDCDTLVLATPNVSDTTLIDELKCERRETHAIGDCVAPRWAVHAIYEGRKIALAL